MRQIYMQKKCEMRQFSANFAVFLAYKFGAFFSDFFAGKFAENCMAILYIFQAIS